MCKYRSMPAGAHVKSNATNNNRVCNRALHFLYIYLPTSLTQTAIFIPTDLHSKFINRSMPMPNYSITFCLIKFG